MRARLDDRNCQCQKAVILCGYSVFFTLHSFLFLWAGGGWGKEREKWEEKAGNLREIFMKDPISETSNDLTYNALYSIFYKHN